MDKYSAEKLNEVHGGRYDYSRYVYMGSETPATFICPIHGEFQQNPYSHAKGRGCIRCAADKRARRSNTAEFITKAKAVHGDAYEYSNVRYVNAKTDVEIVCDAHGLFLQTPDAHLRGQGCPTCGHIKKGLSKRSSTEDFIRKAQEVHPYGYDYSQVEYTTAIDRVTITCSNGHTFEQQPNNHLTGYGCPICQISPIHRMLMDTLGGEPNNREILGGREIDLYFPDERIGFEVNGVYYHSSLHKPRMYHQDKTDLATANDVQLYHIWVDRNTDPDLILSWARAKLGRTENKVAARKSKIRELTSEEYRDFIGFNHLQGAFDAGVRYGLIYGGEIVAAMGFKKQRDGWHLSRFASKRHTVVVGGFTRLLNYFIRHHTPDKIISYSDESYSDGGVYKNNGFNMTRRSSGVRLYYTDGNYLFDRWRFQRNRIMMRRPDIEVGSEKDMALAEGFYPLYGCRTVRWELTI